MRNIQRETDELIFNKINRAVEFCFRTISVHLKAQPYDLRLYIPEYFLNTWKHEYLYRKWDRPLNTVIHPDNFIEYRGVKIVPGYELSVILAHKHAALYYDQLTIKVSLSEDFKIEKPGT